MGLDTKSDRLTVSRNVTLILNSPSPNPLVIYTFSSSPFVQNALNVNVSVRLSVILQAYEGLKSFGKNFICCECGRFSLEVVEYSKFG